MEPAHFDNIHTQIKDSFANKKENRNLIFNSKFQLLLTQLDLFKVLWWIVVALSWVAYLSKNPHPDYFSLGLSFLFWLAVLFLSISYTRETIDNQSDQIDEYGSKLDDFLNFLIDKWHEAITKDDKDVYYNAVQKLSDNFKPNDEIQKSCVWEFMVFLFYSSVLFLIASFFLNPQPICEKTLLVLLVLSISWFLAFSNWSYPFLEFISSIFLRRK